MSEPDDRASAPAEDPSTLFLRLVAAREAARAAIASIEASPARLAEGWERRSVAEGARAEEIVQLYRELGFEVVADPVLARDLPPGCDSCRLAVAAFRTIYTRKSEPGRDPAVGPNAQA